MMFLAITSRLLWFVLSLFCALICMAYFNPFTYQQLVLANLFPPLRALAGHLPWLITGSVFAIVSTQLVTWKSFLFSPGEKKFLTVSVYFFVLLVPGIVGFAEHQGLSNSLSSGGWGLVWALLMFIPSALNLWKALPKGTWRVQGRSCPRDKDFHLFLSLQWVNLVFVAISTYLLPDHFASILILSTLMSMVLYGLFAFLYRLAERSFDSLMIEWLAFALVLAGSIYYSLSAIIFPSLAFVGPIQKTFSILVAVGFVVLLMDYTLVVMNWRLKTMSLHEVNGLHLLFLPFAPGNSRWWKLTINIPVVLLGMFYLNSQLSQFDWNFLGQKAVVVVGCLFTLANLFWALPVKSPLKFHGTHPYVLGLAALVGFSVRQESIYSLEAGNNLALKMLVSVFTSSQSNLNPDFYRLLQNSTNIPKAVIITPKDIQLAKTPIGERTFGENRNVRSKQNSNEVAEPTPITSEVSHYPIILIVIDSLRPDYLTPYNGQSKITPKIDDFAKESIVFRKAFSRYGATGLSQPSIWVGGSLIHQQYVSPFYPMNSLQKLLEIENYRMAVSRDTILRQILKPSERVQDLDPGVDTQNIDLCQTLPRLYQQMKLQPKGKKGEVPASFFAYTQPQNLHISVLNRISQQQTNQSFPGFHQSYSQALNRLDLCFGEFLAQLKADQLYDKTIIIFTADHGDSLGEEGRFGHAYTIFPEIMRIPLIVHLPAELQNLWQWNADDLVFSTDITPSLFAFLGHEPRHDNWILGQSMFWPKKLSSPRKNFEPYLLASSYGAVYGLLDQSGNELYIVDAINFREYLYDLRSNPPALQSINHELRTIKTKQISDRLSELNNFYNYKGSHEEL